MQQLNEKHGHIIEAIYGKFRRPMPSFLSITKFISFNLGSHRYHCDFDGESFHVLEVDNEQLSSTNHSRWVEAVLNGGSRDDAGYVEARIAAETHMAAAWQDDPEIPLIGCTTCHNLLPEGWCGSLCEECAADEARNQL